MLFLLILLAALIAVLWFLWHNRALPYEELARVKKTKRSASNAFPDHEAGKVVGRVRSASAPLIAPISRRPCVYYSVTIEESVTRQLSADEYETSWVERAGETMSQDFLLSDEHGKVRVEADSVTILATAEVLPSRILHETPTAKEVEFLQRIDFHPIPDPVGELRCREFCLVEGERAAVHGLAERDPDISELLFRGTRITVSNNPRVF